MSDHLTVDQIEQLRVQLQVERVRLLAAQTRPVADDAIGDVQDHAAEAARMERDVRLVDHARERLREVDAALVRMTDGTYGICEETGDPIPFARLQIEPTTRYTVDALEIIELERSRDAIRATAAEDDAAY